MFIDYDLGYSEFFLFFRLCFFIPQMGDGTGHNSLWIVLFLKVPSGKINKEGETDLWIFLFVSLILEKLLDALNPVQRDTYQQQVSISRRSVSGEKKLFATKFVGGKRKSNAKVVQSTPLYITTWLPPPLPASQPQK